MFVLRRDSVFVVIVGEVRSKWLRRRLLRRGSDVDDGLWQQVEFWEGTGWAAATWHRPAACRVDRGETSGCELVADPAGGPLIVLEKLFQDSNNADAFRVSKFFQLQMLL